MSDSEKTETEPKTESTTEEKEEEEDKPEKEIEKKSSPRKVAKVTPQKKEEKKESEKEEVEEDDDDDSQEEVEETRLGLLDKPVEMKGRRQRKKVERLSMPEAKPQKEDKNEILEGRGTKLGEIERVDFQIKRVNSDGLKPLHRLLFNKQGSAFKIKRNIRQFSGFSFLKDSPGYEKKENQLVKHTLTGLKEFCGWLDLEKSGSKEDLIHRILDYLMEPQPSGKSLPKPKRKKTKKRKRTASGKGKPKKEKKEKKSKKSSEADDTISDDSDDEQEEDEEEEDEDDDGKDDADTMESDEEVADEPKKKKPRTSSKSPKTKELVSDDDDDAVEDSEGPKKKNQKKEKSPLKKQSTPKKKEKSSPQKAKKESNKAKKEKSPKQEKKKETPKRAKRAKVSVSSDEGSSDDEPLVKKDKSSPPTNAQIKEVIKKILDGANLEEVTMTSVRKQVYAEYPDIDISDRKDFIKTTVKQIIS